MSSFSKSIVAKTAGVTLGLTMGLTNLVFAATINMDAGDILTLSPNTTTTVTCSNTTGSTPGSTPVLDCSKDIQSYRSRYAVCKKGSSPSSCFASEWPAFKTRSPKCVTEGFDVCYSTCEEGSSPSTCFSACR